MAGLRAENKLGDVFNPKNITALAEAIKRNWPSWKRQDWGQWLAEMLFIGYSYPVRTISSIAKEYFY